MPKQVYVITGSRGSGKSTAAARFPKPSELGKMVVIDTEDSMSDIVTNNEKLGLSFGKYIRMYDRFKPSEDMLNRISKGNLPWVSGKQKSALLDYYQYFVETLNSTLDGKKYKYLAIDTIETIEAAMAAWVEVERQKSGWSGSKAYGRLETEGLRPLYENLLESIHQRGVEVIILTSHLRRVWEDDKPIANKVQPGGRLTLLSRLSSMMLWLVPNAGNADGSPAAIVLKARKAIETVENDEWVIRKPLPARIPSFNWANLRRYEREGCDLVNPADGEVPTAEERDMISEFLTDAQMRLMVLGAEKELEEIKLANVVPSFYESEQNGEFDSKIVALVAEGKGNAEIAKETGLTLPEVIKRKARLKESGNGTSE